MTLNIEEIRQYYTGRRILVTAVTSFQGSWLALWLSYLGANVYGISTEKSQEESNYILCNLDSVISHTKVDMRNYIALREYVRVISPEIIYHFSAQSTPQFSHECGVNVLKSSAKKTLNLLEVICKTPSVHTGIIIGTKPCPLNMGKEQKKNHQDELIYSKNIEEMIIQSYQRTFSDRTETPKHIVSVKTGTIIGPGKNGVDKVITEFMSSNGSGTRTELLNAHIKAAWQHVLDAQSGYLLLGAKLKSLGLPEKKNQYSMWEFLPLPENTISIGEVINIMTLLTTEKPFSEILSEKRRFENASAHYTKESRLLEWRPILSIEEAIEWTLSGYHAKGCTSVREHRIKQIETYMSRMNSMCTTIAPATEVSTK